MDEARLHQDQTRAWKAQQLIDNDLLQEALSAIETEVIGQWEQCPARDKDGKEALWQLFKTSKKFRSLLNGYVQSGKLATEMLAQYDRESALKRMIKRVV
jgi:hypothetical protein